LISSELIVVMNFRIKERMEHSMTEEHNSLTPHHRSHKGSIILDDRDLDTLIWIGEQHAISLDHLRLLLGARAKKPTKEPSMLSASATDQVIRRWRTLHLIQQQKILSSTPPWIWLTPHGLRELDLDFKPFSPRLGALSHLHAVNFVRMHTEKHAMGAEWISQRTLLAEQPQRRAGENLPHIPDAEVFYRDASYAIEVELSIKAHARLVSILQELVQMYDFIHYYASEEAARAVYNALSELTADEQKQVKVAQLEHLGYTLIGP
jgi:hypothetical protein